MKKFAIAVAVVLWGCDDSASSPTTTAQEQTATSEEAPRPIGAHANPRESINVDLGHGPEQVFIENIDGKRIFEGDIEIPLNASAIGGRWYQKTVPYVIPSDFPQPERIKAAIAHWQEYTPLQFVQRTNQSDYVRFTAGRGCSAMIGRIGGMQNVTLQAGSNIKSLVGADFNSSGAHFWFSDGLHTVGKSYDVDETSIAASYTLPAGKAFGDVRDMAFATNGDVYTYFRDGTVSVGSPSSLGSKAAPQAFSLPGGRTADTIIGVAFVASGHVRAWYSDSTTSEGTAYDLGAYAAPVAYGAAQAASELLAVGVSGTTAYTWYRNKKASGGTVTDLAATYAPYDVATPGHCGIPEVIHEIGHAIGCEHEQTRWDRDQYITIQWSNINSANSYNFQKHSSSSQDLGPYDYASIMHYDSYAFSTNGQATIVKKNGGLIGYQKGLSTGDISAVAAMYP